MRAGGVSNHSRTDWHGHPCMQQGSIELRQELIRRSADHVVTVRSRLTVRLDCACSTQA